jgi:hypothetical protein
MTTAPNIVAFAAFALVGVASVIFTSSRRRKRDLREYLEPPLQNCGVTYISAVYPGLFKTGPFPKFEVEVGRPQTSVNGTRGEFNEYRVVSFQDSNGRVHQLWALVEFEMFQAKRVRWRAEQKESLPPGVLALLEN